MKERISGAMRVLGGTAATTRCRWSSLITVASIWSDCLLIVQVGKGFWDGDQIKTHSSYTPRCLACSEVASHPNQSCKDNLVFAWLVNHFIFLFGFCFNLTLAPILFALLSVFVHPFPMQKKRPKKWDTLGFLTYEKRDIWWKLTWLVSVPRRQQPQGRGGLNSSSSEKERR